MTKNRKKIIGSSKRPRLCVTKSNQHIYVQIINDTEGKVLSTCSSLTPGIRSKLQNTSTCTAAEIIGKTIARQSIKLGIKYVVFDRRNRLYHGRIKSVADGARNGGLRF